MVVESTLNAEMNNSESKSSFVLHSAGNKISKISPDNWRGLENSLQKLRLGRNAIDKLPADAFAGLTYLDMLDLRENNLKEIDPSVFRDGMAHLIYLYLNGNQLTHIPYAQLSSLKRMKLLDLSYNRISKMLNPQQEPEIRGLQMSLDILRLDYNQIETLMSGDFQHFYKVNRTHLDGNPLTMIEVRFPRYFATMDRNWRFLSLEKVQRFDE